LFRVHVEILIKVVLRWGYDHFGKILVQAMRAFLLYYVKLLHFLLSFSFALIFALAVFSISGRDVRDVCQQAERSWASKATN
jgi:hypothetical protein